MAGKRMYEIWVRIGDKGGVFTPDSNKVIGSLQEAIAHAADVVPKVDEILILEKRVVHRIKGQRPQGNGSEEGQSPPPVPPPSRLPKEEDQA